MNRKERRAVRKRGDLSKTQSPPGAGPSPLAIAELMAQAQQHYRQSRPGPAQEICEHILAREPAHVQALNLLGIVLQSSGRHKQAVKSFAKAIASDPFNAACHYNIASSYQMLDRPDDAIAHFKKAIAHGLSEKNIEDFILQNQTVLGCIERIEKTWPLPPKPEELFTLPVLREIAGDLFLRCTLDCVPLRGQPLERFLTLLRSTLLAAAYAAIVESRPFDEPLAGLLGALAQQCFANEYVFAQNDEETRQAGALRDRLLSALAEGRDIPFVLLAAVAAYYPLHSLPAAAALLRQSRSGIAAGLLQRQIVEPLAEAEDCKVIPALTAIDDAVSLAVMRQYHENPYPRWIVNSRPLFAGDRAMQIASARSSGRPVTDILIAGCGSGLHAIQVAQRHPEVRVLAIDISLASLAYARRKAREEGLDTIAFAQADIMNLATLGRSFDRIEAVGVLHHLAEPLAGWRILLSLLRPRGVMCIGLYSETARRATVKARALIAERGYRPSAEDIRKCRQDLVREDIDHRWRGVTTSYDFYSTSGCRDMLFNVMEHRFTIAQIAAFLREQGLRFVGFDLEPAVIDMFRQRHPDPAALMDLDRWQAFEADHPDTFHAMYQFETCKD